MAKLVKCSLCGHSVSSECNSCPSCGHNVADEIRQNWKEQGLCERCGNDSFVKYERPAYTYIMRTRFGKNIYAKCSACGDYDIENYIEVAEVSVPAEGYYAGTETYGKGLKFGLRKIKG